MIIVAEMDFIDEELGFVLGRYVNSVWEIAAAFVECGQYFHDVANGQRKTKKTITTWTEIENFGRESFSSIYWKEISISWSSRRSFALAALRALGYSAPTRLEVVCNYANPEIHKYITERMSIFRLLKA